MQRSAASTCLHLASLLLQAFLTCAGGWELHGEFARAAAGALAELLYVGPVLNTLPPGGQQLLQQLHGTCTAIHAGPPEGEL